MDFDDTPEEAAFRREARTWLDAHAELLRPGERRETEEPQDPESVRRMQAWQRTKAEGGWACLTWPREYGGRGASPIQSVIWGQEEARYRVPSGSIFLIGHGMMGPTIMAHGNDAQKRRYIPPMLRGDEVWCQLFSEPGAGSDLGNLRTTAVRDGDEWVLNGQKTWTSGAHFSRWGMILTRTDFQASKHDGITYFIMDMHSPGIEIRPIRQISGAKGFNEVFMADVRVPDTNRVGTVNGGWRCAITTLMNERAAIGGSGSGTFENLLRLARETDWGGRPALEDQSVRQRLADFYVKLQGLRYTGYRSLTALSRGATPGPESSIGKLVGAPLGQEMAAFAVELQGAAGSLMDESVSPAEGRWQQAWLGSPGMRLAGGTDEILHNIVAERVLGLPAEPRVDKDVPFKDIPTGPTSR